MVQPSDSKSAEPEAKASPEAMAKTSSASGAADKDTVIEAMPYGTRSRNRTANSRPNYAEDKDIEMDMYDYYPDKKDSDAAKKPSRQTNGVSNGETPRGNGSSRKNAAAAADDSKATPSQNGSQDAKSGGTIHASQATSGTGTLQPSRKRKAAANQNGGAAAAASTATSAAATPPASTTAASKKNALAAQAQLQGMTWPESNMLTFETCKGLPDNGRMVADDGTVLEANDHVYLVCEPPGEPYYLGRIMEFMHTNNDAARPVDAVRINWFYRPKDIGRKASDTRMVFASMHSDISPLTALRGKCQIRHRLEIKSMNDYRRTPDSFWYEKLYDRYIQKNYDLIPTRLIVNVPEKVKKVLDERWQYVLVEQGRGKELTSAVKLCKRCSGYCASNDSVDCAVCQHTYHMNCVKPPLLKKPSRGFAWSCAACSRAQERKLEARHTPNTIDTVDADDDELLDEDEEDAQGIETDRTSPADDDAPHQGTSEQIYQASLWPWRYLGMHCKPEDALDYDDRIYPRAGTRIGPRNQATVGAWPGQPVQYVKPLEFKKGGKKDQKLIKEQQEAEKARRGQRPKWVQDQPPGYVARGEDLDENDPNCTATLLWKPPTSDTPSLDKINDYVAEAMSTAKTLDLPVRSTNLRDAAIESLFREDFDESKALTVLSEKPRSEFKEPNLSPAEVKKFEEGVSKFGSELHLVMKHVKSKPPGEIVRHYYVWKKTEKGQQVWGSFPGRKGKKQARREDIAASKLADDVANDDDDSAFDAEKAVEKKRSFICQFCNRTQDRQWRRAPNPLPGLVNDQGLKGTGKDKAGNQYVVALCRRCAELWRRYAIRYEVIEEVAKKVAQAGGRAWKRKQDEELLKELQLAQEMGYMTPERAPTPSKATASQPGETQEPPRKKLKTAADKELEATPSDAGSTPSAAPTKKKEKAEKAEKAAAEPPAAPEMPKPRTLPCAICDQMEPMGDQHLSCRECRLTVHRNCYGIIDNKVQGKWICDMCANDKSPQVSIQYKCVLCPVEHTEHDFVELPKLTHHKKKMSEKDREREKIEVQQARKAAEYYRKKQEEMNRPVNPREPLKRTADNNWVHVTCAVWTPEVKFGNAKAMEPSEGVPSISRAKYDEICQACNQKGGACVPCHQCRASYHVECARQKGHILGFDIAPVKSSRRDQFNIVTINGESGIMSAVLWCKEHAPTKTIVHRIHDVVSDTGLNALQLYVQNFKQADFTLTGTVRKANQMTTAAKVSGAPAQAWNRRASTTTAPNGTWAPPRNGDVADPGSHPQHPGDKICITCGIDVALRWWPIDNFQERRLTNGHHGVIGSEAQRFVEQRKFQCQKCHKLRKTPRSPGLTLRTGPSPPPSDLARPQPMEATLMAPVPPMRGSTPPPPPPPPNVVDYRDGRHMSHPLSWPQPPPGSHAMPAVSTPPPMPTPLHAPAQVAGHRPPPMAHPYPPAQPPPPPGRTTAYPEWAPPHRPSSQHNSPPRHINGGPPAYVARRPAPASTTTSLEPFSSETACHGWSASSCTASWWSSAWTWLYQRAPSFPTTHEWTNCSRSVRPSLSQRTSRPRRTYPPPGSPYE
ncbi:uncharacterized protein TrAtP1_004232 [Trichoderma atroviride]|uniref:uncharacterized protein n=2 Tax=Hypocrea atroviridis TaxID=63577 RepID=UPI0033280060|nr:hypothetical protein TrAtP1_004232 [Trichoderma atroviride]